MSCLEKILVMIVWMINTVHCEIGFHMINMTTVPPSGPDNIVPENQTMSLYGQSYLPYTLCSLYFKDKFLCRQGQGANICDASLSANISRFGNVTVKPMVDDTWCGFEVPFLSIADSGKWKIGMRKLEPTDITDSKEVIVEVSTLTTLQLSLYTMEEYSSDNKNMQKAASDNTQLESVMNNTEKVLYEEDVCMKSSVEVVVGETLVGNCSSIGGLPVVEDFSWTIMSDQDNATVQWNLTYSQVHHGQGITSQVVTARPLDIGSFLLICSVEQTGYYSSVSIETEVVVVSSSVDPDDGSVGGNLDKFTITFIVLGIVFFFIIIIFLIVALVTRTFCFAESKPREQKDGKKKARKEDNTIRSITHEKNTAVDTNYVVGQDFRENDQRSSQASESLSSQYEQGRPSGFISASQYQQENGQYRQFGQGGVGLEESGDTRQQNNFRRHPQLYSGQPRNSSKMEDRGFSGYSEENQHRGALV